jgi:hypothetical protein
MIQLKSAREIELMAEGGRILADTRALMRREVRAGISTMELDAMAEEFIRSHPGATPAFKGLYGFPGSLCASINNEIVHGIPSKKRVLKDGDIISIDLGVGFKGYYTDSATTVAVGTVDERRLACSRPRSVRSQRALLRRCRAITSATSARQCSAWWKRRVQRRARSRGPRHRCGVSRGAAGAELRQAEAWNQADAGPHVGDRADGEHRRSGDSDAAGQMDDRHCGRVKVGALRAYGGNYRSWKSCLNGGLTATR